MWRKSLTVFCAGIVDEDSAGRVAADQVVDEGQEHEESCGGSCESQAGQTFGKRSNQVKWQVAGEDHNV